MSKLWRSEDSTSKQEAERFLDILLMAKEVKDFIVE
jgi:hypothetical protein